METTKKIKHLGWWIAAGILIIIIISADNLVEIITDYFWFGELGFTSIFFKILFSKIGITSITGIVSFILIYGNMLIAQRLCQKVSYYENSQFFSYIESYGITPFIKYILPFAALVTAFFLGSISSNYWDLFLKFKGATSFGINDPLLGKDVGFYVFKLPFYKLVFNGSLAVLIFSLIGSLIVYFLKQNLLFHPRGVVINNNAKAHLLILTGIILASFYFFFQFKIYSLVNGSGHVVNGAGYADIHFYLPFLKVMQYISLIAAILVWINIRYKTLKFALVGVLLVFVVHLLGKGTSGFVQKFIVAPNEVTKEKPYIEWSIKNTRKAYNLDAIEEKNFTPTEDLTREILKKNDLTINNVRLWNQAPLLKTFAQLQEIRTYYKFLDVDNDRYMINNKYRQVMFSPRELVPASLPSRIWINEHLTYTHGYGLCMGPVNDVTDEGLPEFFIKDIPPSSFADVTVNRPEIYYGEADAGYAIVNTKLKEFDYPSGDQNVYTKYMGSGGVKMGGFLKKLLFVIRFREIKILLSSDITSQSKILYFRQIGDRVKKAMPFLEYDSDPYMVITKDGRLMWFIDAYTVSSMYPYSAYVRGIGNYIRNSVKTIVDAYNGNISFYVSDTTDPIIKAYDKIFPNIFKPLSQMSPDLRSHIRYPQTLFAIQAKVYALYHMTDPQVFYNKEDLWKIPESYYEGQSTQMSPYFTIMKLAGVGEKEEFILMVPFCPAKKENMIAWFAARCDEPNYGKLLVFNFPKQQLVYGPSQIESRINQDPEISKQVTLWSQGGSRIIWGSLLVIPVEQSLLYVQPLYLSASQGSGVPELKRVIVAYGNNIAMEETLEKSLGAIFGGMIQDKKEETKKGEAPIPQEEVTIKKLIFEANKQFEKAWEELAKKN